MIINVVTPRTIGGHQLEFLEVLVHGTSMTIGTVEPRSISDGFSRKNAEIPHDPQTLRTTQALLRKVDSTVRATGLTQTKISPVLTTHSQQPVPDLVLLTFGNEVGLGQRQVFQTGNVQQIQVVSVRHFQGALFFHCLVHVKEDVQYEEGQFIQLTLLQCSSGLVEGLVCRDGAHVSEETEVHSTSQLGFVLRSQEVAQTKQVTHLQYSGELCT
jgi:hypothetical protein